MRPIYERLLQPQSSPQPQPQQPPIDPNPLPIAPFDCLLPIAYLPIAYCLLPIAYCLLPIAYCLFPVPYSLFPVPSPPRKPQPLQETEVFSANSVSPTQSQLIGILNLVEIGRNVIFP